MTSILSEDRSQSAICFLDIISQQLQQFFDQACDHYATTRISIKSILKIENSSLDKGDISLFFSPGSYTELASNLEEIAHDLRSKLCKFFSDCIALHNNRLKLVLNKSQSFSFCVEQIFKQKQYYGSHKSKEFGVALILVHSDESSSLTNFRTIKLAEHLISVMLMNGFKIYCDKILLNNELCLKTSDLQCYDCSNCDIESSYSDFEDKLHGTEWLLEEDTLLQNMKIKHSDDVMVVDGKRYLEKSSVGKCNYDKNIGYIFLKKGTYTDCFKQGAVMKHIIDKHTCDVDVVFHIVPLKKHFLMRQSGLIFDILNKKTRNIFLVHQQASTKNQENATVETYRKMRLFEMEQALAHKYGENILQDEGWKAVVELLVETVTKFDFLFTSSSAPLKVCCSPSGHAIRDKGGAFVQYNCARLTTIFKQFEKNVKTGKYKPMPEISEVDFSYLQLPEEWNMFFNYVIPFPKITADIVESLRNGQIVEVPIPTHKIAQLLVSLSHEFSIYYNKHKILVEPYPQLLQKMYPRLYLLHAIYQVMKNGLMLLNLPAAEKM